MEYIPTILSIIFIIAVVVYVKYKIYCLNEELEAMRKRIAMLESKHKQAQSHKLYGAGSTDEDLRY